MANTSQVAVLAANHHRGGQYMEATLQQLAASDPNLTVKTTRYRLEVMLSNGDVITFMVFSVPLSADRLRGPNFTHILDPEGYLVFFQNLTLAARGIPGITTPYRKPETLASSLIHPSTGTPPKGSHS